MFDWKVVFNMFASAAAAGVVAGATNFAAQPTMPWQVHAAVAVGAAASYLAGHLRQSPLPGKP